MSQLAIVEASSHLPDQRQSSGKRHQQALCLALFTLAVTAGNRGFLAIGDWLKAYHSELVALELHPAILLVTAYIVERGLILEPYECRAKPMKSQRCLLSSNRWHWREWSLPLMPSAPKKTLRPLLRKRYRL